MAFKVSIIVPVFNEEVYLPKLLDSILQQSMKPFEVIICDNNSTDQSLKIAKKYTKLLPLKIIHQQKMGIIPCLEKLWHCAAGNIIVRTDADAILPHNYLKNCRKIFDNNPDIHATTGPMFSAETHIIYSMLYPLGTILGNYLLFLLRGYPSILGPNTVVRRNCLEQINGYLTNSSDLDDQLLTKKLHAHHFKIAYVFSLWNYHSTRRWIKNPFNILRSLVVNINPKYYRVKTQ